jgi:5'/3'-nucleotidase SurE
MLALDGGPYDLVISGINNGYNAGLAPTCPGTVGAAREAAFQRMPALAVSAHPRTPKETVQFFAKLGRPPGRAPDGISIPAQSVCNVNVPPVEISGLKEPLYVPHQTAAFTRTVKRSVSVPGRHVLLAHPRNPRRTTPTPAATWTCSTADTSSCTFLTPDPCRQPACDTLLSTMA